MTSTVSNWAGNIAFTPQRFHEPTSVDELRGLVARSAHVRALGTAHSFNRIADTDGDLISLAAMPRIVDIDANRGTVTVSAGVRYGDLAQELHAAGFALRNLASLPHISVAGAVATGTHGSGDANGSLATSVSALEMVTATGDLDIVSREGDGELFPGAVVALGCLGIVTRLRLDIVPTFTVAQTVYENLSREQLTRDWAEIFGGGYSVSLFTDWRGTGVNEVWRKQTEGASPEPWLGLRPAGGPRHPVTGMPPENTTEQLGVAGPWHERLPHFRLGYTPSSGEELQSEYLVPRDRVIDALTALDAVSDRIAPLLLISEIRTIAADDLWLSPSYGRDSVAIHFTWKPDAAAVGAVLVEIEALLAPFGARPHWGKVFSTSPEVVAGLYDRLPDFVKLTRRYDPSGKFRNDFVDRYLLAV